MNWGIFKEVYRGDGIYWAGTYNVEGFGNFKTKKEAFNYIDQKLQNSYKKEKEEKIKKIEKGEAIAAQRNGDLVTINFPDLIKTVTIREYRQKVFDWEDLYKKEIVLM